MNESPVSNWPQTTDTIVLLSRALATRPIHQALEILGEAISCPGLALYDTSQQPSRLVASVGLERKTMVDVDLAGGSGIWVRGSSESHPLAGALPQCQCIAWASSPGSTLVCTFGDVIEWSDAVAEDLAIFAILLDPRDVAEPAKLPHGSAPNTFWDSVANLRDAIERLGEGIIVTDHAEQIQFANRAVINLLGYEPDDMLGRNAIELLFEENEWEAMRQRHRDRLAGQDEKYETKLMRADGSPCWVEVKAIPLSGHGDTIEGTFAAITDVTDRRASLESLRASEDLFRSMFEAAPVGIAIVATDGVIIRANERLTEMFAHRADLTLQPVKSLLDPGMPSSLEDQLARVAQGEREDWRGECRLAGTPGRPLYGNVTLSAVREAGNTRFMVAMIEDITERRRAEDQLHYLAHHSPLTDLPNRVLFLDAIDQARLRSALMAVVVMDIDRFKIITHTLGRQFADHLLRVVATRLRECSRPGDLIAHLGGDQFALLLLDIEDARTAIANASRLLEALEPAFFIGGHELVVSASAGVGLYPHHGRAPDQLVKHAQTAMFSAKEQGRSNVQLYEAEMSVTATQRFSLEGDLRKALDREEFIVHYQPQVDLSSGCIVGVEALVRWRHPDLGMLPPGTFIPVAEDSGLIVPLGEWVLREACGQANEWIRAGHQISVSVNLSAGQFHERNLVSAAAEILADTRLAPDRLELEITENTLMVDMGRAINSLRELKEIGVSLSIDDFGTGYSSLSYLKRFPIDALKIDRSFVRDVVNDPSDEAIVTAIIAMAHSLNLRVVAEGVELEEQRAHLCRLACDSMQGFLCSPPLGADELTTLLESNSAIQSRS